MKRAILIFLTATAMILAAGAGAKPLSRIIAELGLSPEDFQLMGAASRQLVVDDRPVVGREATWENAATDSRGSVRVDAVQGDCAVLHHTIHPTGAEQAKLIGTRLCKGADGVWMMTP
ncbi:hypothetical protein [Ruegeria marina]|uniref:Outer membrane surface antigen n=1 Tax=Ruegeria marina TaxID=639004 RepID=A0A1G6T9Z0_9RHOB|nr:hypothetical protein [Ruegeria marina]SDD25833.1 hypothetical protein SAMN04488239_10645 [Ruegeria marina]